MGCSFWSQAPVPRMAMRLSPHRAFLQASLCTSCLPPSMSQLNIPIVLSLYSFPRMFLASTQKKCLSHSEHPSEISNIPCPLT